MDFVMLASLMDELEKMAENVSLSALSGSAVAKPTSIVGNTMTTSATKPSNKPTNYSTVHSQSPVAATGTANSTKFAPPPPVRA